MERTRSESNKLKVAEPLCSSNSCLEQLAQIVELDYGKTESYGKALDTVNAIYSSSPDPALKGHQEFCSFMAENKDIRERINHVVRFQSSDP